MAQWIFLESFPDEIQAAVAKSQLEAAGITVQQKLNPMGDALLGAVGLQNGPTDLFVSAEDMERAKELLKIL